MSFVSFRLSVSVPLAPVLIHPFGERVSSAPDVAYL